MVARLKWGDPFVFDRGGEEALFLHEHAVPFEVIPGIPAAIGIPAYAGIPITYPGGGDSVTLVRGREAEHGKKPHVDWTSLGKLGGTVICYCGPKELQGMLDSMLSHGWSKNEAAALIFNGSLPNQETIQATIGELAALARQPKFRNPAMLVVGRVTGLREHLRWFDARPLFGKRIVVTRPREQAADLVEALDQLGATVIEAPTVRIVAAGGFRAARRGVCHGRPVRLGRVHEPERRGLLLPADAAGADRHAGARGGQAVRDRPGHGRAPRPALPAARRDSARVLRRVGGGGDARRGGPRRERRSCCRAPTRRASSSRRHCGRPAGS